LEFKIFGKAKYFKLNKKLHLLVESTLAQNHSANLIFSHVFPTFELLNFSQKNIAHESQKKPHYPHFIF